MNQALTLTFEWTLLRFTRQFQLNTQEDFA